MQIPNVLLASRNPYYDRLSMYRLPPGSPKPLGRVSQDNNTLSAGSSPPKHPDFAYHGFNSWGLHLYFEGSDDVYLKSLLAYAEHQPLTRSSLLIPAPNKAHIPYSGRGCNIVGFCCPFQWWNWPRLPCILQRRIYLSTRSFYRSSPLEGNLKLTLAKAHVETLVDLCGAVCPHDSHC